MCDAITSAASLREAKGNADVFVQREFLRKSLVSASIVRANVSANKLQAGEVLSAAAI